MTGLALSLVLLSAFAHASWNLLAKRAGGGPGFLWLFGALSVLIYAPITAISIILEQPHVGLVELAFMFGSTVLHLAYFLLLSSSDRAGDLSLVYPLARHRSPARHSGRDTFPRRAAHRSRDRGSVAHRRRHLSTHKRHT
ncbi:MAG: hypothetical protein M3P51_05665 [Chloroflexota bacterium]|nr:hypothetical protein [Chloroflexota bacterium]